MLVPCVAVLLALAGCQAQRPNAEVIERRPRPAAAAPAAPGPSSAAPGNSSDSATAPARHEFSHRQMGTYFRIVIYSNDEAAARAAAEAAFQRVDQFNAIFSDYDPASETSRLSATAGSGRSVKVSDDLWKLLRESDRFSRQTDGLFDVTVGPVVLLWRAARTSRQLPTSDQLAKALRAVGYNKIDYDEAAKSVTLREPGMRLDFGGIAVGYTLDVLMAMLKARGFTRVLIDGGGDILLGDPPPNRDGWRIGIASLEGKDGPPSRFVILSNAAITTSGDMFRFVEIGGKRYSHIIDPRTGLGLTDHSNVTLIAKDATTNDALSKVVSVLGPVKGIELIDRIDGAAAIIERKPGKKLESFESSRVKHLKTEQRSTGETP